MIFACNPNSLDNYAKVLSPLSAANATLALNSLLCCFLILDLLRLGRILHLSYTILLVQFSGSIIGAISHELAVEHAEKQYDQFYQKQIKVHDKLESDFDKTLKIVESKTAARKLPKKKKTK